MSKYCGTCLALAVDEPCKDCDNYSKWTSKPGYSAELSRLRELVGEMRDYMQSLNPSTGHCVMPVERTISTLISKADAILKESGDGNG